MDIAAFLIDIDGVLHVGDRPVNGARESLRALEERGYPYRFVSNTTRRSRRSLAERLQGLGFSIPENAIVTAPLAAVALMKERGWTRCFLLSTGDVHRDFEEAGITLSEDEADVVVVADAGEHFTYERMNAAFRLLAEGAALMALEKDRCWMGSGGLMLSAGPFVAALEYAAGTRAEVVGKPSREFFALALEQMDADFETTAMIGDDVATDIGGAQACGMQGILAKTGKYREDAVRNSGIVPDLVIDSIADITDHL
ncbi:MAG: TIGR01458 family HAD-type hydrolase [Methanomicrobiaceae archaeon]|nr:TIGR01458 family HAD-type hydrolase [Methanomicrobiaceae archaeon]MDD5419600.1 TIGR01458 family HAD-type hydrolase [Methanomicrobiaceae archaeon]